MTAISAHELTVTALCRQPGCTEVAVRTRGPGSYRCPSHMKRRGRGAEAPAETIAGAAVVRPATPEPNGIGARLAELQSLVVSIDDLRGEAKAATERALNLNEQVREGERELRRRIADLAREQTPRAAA